MFGTPAQFFSILKKKDIANLKKDMAKEQKPKSEKKVPPEKPGGKGGTKKK